MRAYYEGFRQTLLVCLVLCCAVSVHAQDRDEEDEMLTPDDNLVADVMAEERALAKKEKRELRFKDVTIVTAQGAPLIDGDLSDPFWDQAQTFHLEYEVSPAKLGQAKLDTKAWFATTSSHIYLAFDAKGPIPDRLRSARRSHDGGKEDDYVSFTIDTTGTGARKYEFRVNPHGSKGDTISDGIASRSGHDWDADWEAAASIYEGGYRAEMAVPIAAIRAPARVIEDRKGVVLLKRYIPRRLKVVNAAFFTYDANQFVEEQQRLAETAEAVPFLKRWHGLAHTIYHLDEKRKLGEEEWERVDSHDELSGGLDFGYSFDNSRTVQLYALSPTLRTSKVISPATD